MATSGAFQLTRMCLLQCLVFGVKAIASCPDTRCMLDINKNAIHESSMHLCSQTAVSFSLPGCVFYIACAWVRNLKQHMSHGSMMLCIRVLCNYVVKTPVFFSLPACVSYTACAWVQSLKWQLSQLHCSGSSLHASLPTPPVMTSVSSSQLKHTTKIQQGVNKRNCLAQF